MSPLAPVPPALFFAVLSFVFSTRLARDLPFLHSLTKRFLSVGHKDDPAQGSLPLGAPSRSWGQGWESKEISIMLGGKTYGQSMDEVLWEPRGVCDSLPEGTGRLSRGRAQLNGVSGDKEQLPREAAGAPQPLCAQPGDGMGWENRCFFIPRPMSSEEESSDVGGVSRPASPGDSTGLIGSAW